MIKDTLEPLKKIREKKGYSYLDMADLLGISKSYYWQIEHKKKRLSYDMALKIASIFEVKPDELFYDEF